MNSTDYSTAYVKVYPPIREFILDTNGSDLLIPQRNDWLWLLVKQHLITVPAKAVPIPTEDKESYIKIALLDASNSKVYVLDSRRTIYINTLYRSYISAAGQSVIACQLRTIFKECFHNFIQGAIFANPEMEVKEAIGDFCLLHNLTLTDITYDMLIKSWQRSPQRKKIKDPISFTHCPVKM